MDNKSKVDLSKIEEVKLDNGNKYIKYIDPNTNRPVMLDITYNKKSAQEIIESIQAGSFSFNSNDAVSNTNGILGLEKKYTMHGLQIIPVEEVNKFANVISTEKKPIVDLFYTNKDKFKPPIKYINVEEDIALDEANNVIMCMFNKDENRFDVRYADTTKYEIETKEQSMNETPTTQSINQDDIVNKLINNQPIEINGKQIEAEFLINNQDQIYRFIPENQVKIWKQIFAKYDAVKQKESDEYKKENPPKVLQLKNNPKRNQQTNNAAFVTNNLTLFVGGFTTGIIFALILYYVIKMIF